MEFVILILVLLGKNHEKIRLKGDFILSIFRRGSRAQTTFYKLMQEKRIFKEITC